MSLNHRRLREPGYDRRLVVPDDPPSEALLRMYGEQEVQLVQGGGAAEPWPLCSMGGLQLFLAPRGTRRAGSRVLVREPVICWKRGVDEGDFVGLDDAVCTSQFWVDRGRPAPPSPADASRPAPSAEALASLQELRPPREDPGRLGEALQLMGLPRVRSLPRPAMRRLRVALIDTSFSGLSSLQGFGRYLREETVTLQSGLEYPLPKGPALQRSLGHGTAMAAVLLHALGAEEFQFRLFQLAHDDRAIGNRDRGWLDATALTVALARAVGEWGADVVGIPMSAGCWGAPAHLRAVLREAWRTGRAGKGAAILCSVGAPDTNSDAADSGASCALGVDELASQPWVMTVAASDEQGRWYRRYLRVASSTFPVNRFGPGVAFSAPGAVYVLEGVGGVDDSSLASMLGTAAAAWVLRFNPGLSAPELREVLQRTCDIPPVVDDGPGLASERFNKWDRWGLGFKSGAGRVNALAAVLAAADPLCHALLMTRPCPGRIPSPGVAESDPAMLRALAWFEWTSSAALAPTRAGHPLWEQYLALRGRLSRMLLHSLPLQEGLGWLARHLMALWSSEAEPSRAGAPDHRAFLHRLQDTLRVLEWEAEQLEEEEGPRVRAWARALSESLDESPERCAALHRFLFGKVGGPWGTPIH